MTQIYTQVSAGVSYCCYGRKTRAQAIAEARASYAQSLKEAQEFLSTPEDHLEVTVISGIVRTKILEELHPSVEPTCLHERTTTHYDCHTCSECGAFLADSGWGIAKNKWFKSRDDALFYKKNGYLPA